MNKWTRLLFCAVAGWFLVTPLLGGEGRPDLLQSLGPALSVRPVGSYREAADPVIVLYKGAYWLFASKSGGYWRSDDLLHWSFIEPKGLPLEPYAPAVAAVNGRLYYTCSFSSEGTFVTDDPASGSWTNVAASPQTYADAATFLDDDGRLYIYSGCDAMGSIKVNEMDPVSFKAITPRTTCTGPDLDHRGWKSRGTSTVAERSVTTASTASALGLKAPG